MDINAKFEELQKAVGEFKTSNDARIKELEKKGAADTTLVEKVDKANADITRLQDEIKQYQAAANRTNRSTEEGKDGDKNAEHKAAFLKFLRKGEQGLTDAEKKFMATDSDSDGGFLVMPEQSSEIVKKVFESSPMRQVASVQTISTNSLEILEDLDQVESGWVGETQVRPDTATPKLNKIEIPTHELYAQPLVTQKLLDDAAVNVEAWLSGKVAEKFARDEATAFISGDGVAKPKGILSYASGTGFNQIEQIETASSGVLGADDMIKLFYALKSAYVNGASWGMKRSTEEKLRLLKDSQLRYLWAPALEASAPSTFLGAPIYQMNDMPAVAASALSVVWGDMKQGYQIVDRIGIRVIRDVYTSKPFVKFYSTKRVGGGVKNFEAMKLLKIKA
jgi:HK97 family phage major capsid protein